MTDSTAPRLLPQGAGPLLYARGADGRRCRLTALMVTGEDAAPPDLVPDEAAAPVPPRRLATLCGRAVWRYDFDLPVRPGAAYRVGGESFPVVTDLSGDVRVGFVSCNGQEHGDVRRSLTERDALWQRLCAEHAEAPFALLLHGGDQLYADEVEDCHPELKRWSGLPRRHRGAVPFTAEMAKAARQYYFTRYLWQAAQPAMAWMFARVPSLMMWDDHDIIDGWGSHRPGVQESPVGKGLFAIAREMFALFQLGALADEPPDLCPDRSGRNFTFHARLPGFSVVAPDLRSERQPNRIMAEVGWSAYETALREAAGRVLLMSSVPVLGPRLSFLQMFLDWLPGAQQYEDDLRDQWQSRSHREEWKRLLYGIERHSVDGHSPVTVVSGEIHLATRGEMELAEGHMLHQLVASGIAHPPPPRKYALALGLLARFGGAPLPGRTIRLLPLPGQADTYTAQRNYLVLERISGRWSAAWELENSGRTPPLQL